MFCLFVCFSQKVDDLPIKTNVENKAESIDFSNIVSGKCLYVFHFTFEMLDIGHLYH